MKLIITFITLFFLETTWGTTNILFLGDSLTEGYGVDEAQAFPHLIEQELQKKKFDIKIINGGVSGSTSMSGKSRLTWHLKTKVDVLVLELGANDGLRGLKISNTEKNLKSIIQLAHEKKIKVLLLGLLMPPNYGQKYTNEFEAMYKNISHDEKVPLMPFMLKEIAGKPDYNQADGIHPNAKGHQIIAKSISIFIEKNL